MMPLDADLFGLPRCNPELSQWMTPAWLARRIARWVPLTARVLEPGAGSGNLIQALVDAGHYMQLISANDIDTRWCEHLRRRFPCLGVCHYDFLAKGFAPLLTHHERAFDVVVMNPPFEEGKHAQFVLHALALAPLVITVAPVSIEFGGERDRDLWSKARIVRRAKLPERVQYGGDDSPKFDSVVLKIARRDQPRPVDENLVIVEEVWRRAA